MNLVTQLFRYTTLALIIWLAGAAATTAQDSQDLTALTQSIKKIKGNQQNTTAGGSGATVDPDNPVYRQILNSVGYIVCESETKGAWQGTGWVLNEQNRLLVTNQHVIEGVEECVVFFPEFKDQKLVTDKAETLNSNRGIRARVIDSCRHCDLALLQLESLPEQAKSLTLAETSAAPGQRVHSIAGNSAGSESLWIYSTGHVRQVATGTLANGYESTLLESDMATNQGNSGGPVVNDQGQVVAVVEGHRTDARLVSIYVDLQALVSYLEEGLRCVAPQTYEDFDFVIQRHLAEDRYETALKLAGQMHKLDKKRGQPLAYRGWCFLLKEDFDTARQEFNKAIKNDDQCGDAHAGLGQLAVLDEDYETAIEHFSAAISCENDNLKYQQGRAQVRLLQGEFETAKKEFERILKQDPTAHQAIFGLGYAEVQLGEYDNGMQRFDYLLTHHTGDYQNNPELFYQAGVAFEGMENLENAVGSYAHAIELDPNKVEAHRELGGLLIRVQNFDKAVEVLTAANELYQDDAFVNFYLGAAYVGLGDSATGRPYLDKAKELNADEEEADESLLEEIDALIAHIDSQSN
jgi:tetratricopeptide (TPR) repeat protein